MDFEVSVRNAIPSDAERLAALGMQVWLHTYATNGISQDIASYVLMEFTAAKMSALLADPSAVVLVAEAAGCLAGYATLQLDMPCPSDSTATVELATLYIQAHFSRQGLGTRLLARAEQAVRDRAGSALWLTVNAHNATAISFYTAHGYTKIGTAYFSLGNTQHENHVLVSQAALPEQ